MEVVKRDGTREYVKFEKISSRIKKQTYGLNEDYVDYFEVSKKMYLHFFSMYLIKYGVYMRFFVFVTL